MINNKFLINPIDYKNFNFSTFLQTLSRSSKVAKKCYKTKTLVDIQYLKYYQYGKGYDKKETIRKLKVYTHLMINSSANNKNHYFVIDLDKPTKDINSKLQYLEDNNLLPTYIIINNNYKIPHIQLIFQLESNYHKNYYWDKFLYTHKLLKQYFNDDPNAQNTWCRNPLYFDKNIKSYCINNLINLDSFDKLPNYNTNDIESKREYKKIIVNYQSFLSTKSLPNLFNGFVYTDGNNKPSRHLTLFKLTLKAINQIYKNSILPENIEDDIYNLYIQVNNQFQDPLNETEIIYHSQQISKFILQNHDPTKGIDYNSTINRFAYRENVKHLDNIPNSLSQKQAISGKLSAQKRANTSQFRLKKYIQKMKDENLKISKYSLYNYMKSKGEKISENTIKKHFDTII